MFFCPRHHPETRQTPRDTIPRHAETPRDTPRHARDTPRHPETRQDTPETTSRDMGFPCFLFEKLTPSADTNCCKQNFVRTGLKNAIGIQELQGCHHPNWWYIADDYSICLWDMRRRKKKPNMKRLRLSHRGLSPLMLATYIWSYTYILKNDNIIVYIQIHTNCHPNPNAIPTQVPKNSSFFDNIWKHAFWTAFKLSNL